MDHHAEAMWHLRRNELTMKVEPVSQIAGRDSFAAKLNELLGNGEYNSFRFLLAYVRWSGLHLVDAALQLFAARGSIDGIVSIDFGGTTVEALTYLAELPSSRVRIFESGDPTVGFHPKVFLFDGPERWAAIIGSANGSTGGLYNNVEIGTVLTGSSREKNPFDPVWKQLSDPQPPVNPDNLILVDNSTLDDLAPLLDHYTKQAPDRPRRVGLRRPTPVHRAGTPPSPGRPPAPRTPKGTPPPAVPTVTETTPPMTGAGTLFVELWDETGGGTQVRFPKKVITDYFGASLHSITWLALSVPSGPVSVRIQVFPNNTYRIPLRFTEGVPRKAVLRFKRTGKDRYEVRAVPSTSRRYPTWLKKCTNETRRGSKRWGVE